MTIESFDILYQREATAEISVDVYIYIAYKGNPLKHRKGEEFALEYQVRNERLFRL